MQARKYAKGAVAALSALGASNITANPRADDDYYATDPIAARLLMEKEKFAPVIREPACGEGHLAKEFARAGYEVIASDLIDRGYGFVRDFFTFNAPPVSGADIVTNPPFKCAAEFVEHAIDIAEDGRKIAMFLKIQFLEGQRRRKLFDKYPPKKIYVSSSRICCAPNGNFTNIEHRSAICYAWYVWVKGCTSKTTLDWIN